MSDSEFTTNQFGNCPRSMSYTTQKNWNTFISIKFLASIANANHSWSWSNIDLKILRYVFKNSACILDPIYQIYFHESKLYQVSKLPNTISE